jgi:hydrogenase maturation protease
MAQPGILIAGIGNIFLGDDAFGCEVLKHLSQRAWPDNVRVVDFGIRGFDLAYALLEGFDLAILVDATPRGEAPGTLYVIEPDLSELETLDANAMAVETHGMNPAKVLSMVKSMGGQLNRVMLVGCEPETFGPEEGLMGLSQPVAGAVPEAVKMVETLVNKHLRASVSLWLDFTTETQRHGDIT